MVTSTLTVTSTEPLMVSLVRTVSYAVTPQDSVRSIALSDEFARYKPAVMASARLLAICEWPCMDLLRKLIAPHECSLGTSQTLDHLAPIRIGTRLVITARVEAVHGNHSAWYVEAYDQHIGGTRVARAHLAFTVVALAAFERRLNAVPPTPSHAPVSTVSASL